VKLHYRYLACFQLQFQQVHWQLFLVYLLPLRSHITHSHSPGLCLFLIQKTQTPACLTISKQEILLRGLDSRFELLMLVCVAGASICFLFAFYLHFCLHMHGRLVKLGIVCFVALHALAALHNLRLLFYCTYVPNNCISADKNYIAH